MQADASDDDALGRSGAADFDHAIVAISGDAESSIFATMALQQPRRRERLAKAGTALHGSILERVGADRVVYPEREMGAQVAHAFASPTSSTTSTSRPAFGIVRVTAPPAWIGRTLGELDLAGRGLTGVALRRGDRADRQPRPGDRIESGDELVLIAADERLAQLERE